MKQLGAFLGTLAYTIGAFLFGYYAGQIEPGNFNDDVILDPSQVIIRPFTYPAR